MANPNPSPKTRFQKGQPSANPKGRPKKVRELLELARGESEANFKLAKDLRDNEELDPKVRLEAAKFLTQYGLGGPPTSGVLVEEDDEVQTSAGLDVKTAAKVLKLVRGKGRREPVDDE